METLAWTPEWTPEWPSEWTPEWTPTDLFVHACDSGDVAEAGRLLKTHGEEVDVHWNDDSAFRAVCMLGKRADIVAAAALINPVSWTEAFLSACEVANVDGVLAIVKDLGMCGKDAALAQGIRRCVDLASSYVNAPARVTCLDTLWDLLEDPAGSMDVHEDHDRMYRIAVDSGHDGLLAWVVAKGGGPQMAWPRKVGACEPKWHTHAGTPIPECF